MNKYTVKYKDNFGEEETEISSDGSTMCLILRGIKFKGTDFEGLEGEVDKSKFQYEIYEKGIGYLTNFKMKVIFPIKIYHENKIVTERIKFEIEVGKELEIDGLEPMVNTIELNTSFGNFKFDKKVAFFEDSIIEIQNMLPKKTQFITCLSCKYSNYSPFGNGMFGSLYCFKKIKEKLTNVSNKSDLTDLWTEDAMKNKDIFNVQEIFDCLEHQFITKNDWTYKDWDYRTNCVQ